MRRRAISLSRNCIANSQAGEADSNHSNITFTLCQGPFTFFVFPDESRIVILPYGGAMIANLVRLDRRLPSFAVREVTFSGSTTVDPHRHERPMMVAVLEGSYRQTVDRRTDEVAAGQVLLLPAQNEVVVEIPRGGARSLLVTPLNQRVTDVEHELFGRIGISKPGVTGPLVRRIRGELSHADHDRWGAITLEGLFLQLLATIGREAKTDLVDAPPAWLLGAKEMLNQRFRESITLADVARSAGVSRAQLARRFRAVFGTSVGAYLRARRLDAAVKHLRGGDASLTEVAVGNGFYDQSHLTRVCRQELAQTPLEIRRRAQRVPRAALASHRTGVPPVPATG